MYQNYINIVNYYSLMGSFPLYLCYFLYNGRPLHPFFGGTSVMSELPLVRFTALDQKNRKYPFTCYIAPSQVSHRITAVYSLHIRRVIHNNITLFKIE